MNPFSPSIPNASTCTPNVLDPTDFIDYNKAEIEIPYDLYPSRDLQSPNGIDDTNTTYYPIFKTPYSPTQSQKSQTRFLGKHNPCKAEYENNVSSSHGDDDPPPPSFALAVSCGG